MPDTVLTLKTVLKEVAVVDAKTIQAGIAQPQPVKVPVVEFVIQLRSPNPRGQCRLRLWDAYGRNPKVIDQNGSVGEQAKDWNFSKPLGETIRLQREPEDLRNNTLTWSIRFLAKQPDNGERYALLVQVLQEEVVLPGGNFSYSGPLDDNEEIVGRFHFAIAP